MPIVATPGVGIPRGMRAATIGRPDIAPAGVTDETGSSEIVHPIPMHTIPQMVSREERES